MTDSIAVIVAKISKDTQYMREQHTKDWKQVNKRMDEHNSHMKEMNGNIAEARELGVSNKARIDLTGKYFAVIATAFVTILVVVSKIAVDGYLL